MGSIITGKEQTVLKKSHRLIWDVCSQLCKYKTSLIHIACSFYYFEELHSFQNAIPYGNILEVWIILLFPASRGSFPGKEPLLVEKLAIGYTSSLTFKNDSNITFQKLIFPDLLEGNNFHCYSPIETLLSKLLSGWYK